MIFPTKMERLLSGTVSNNYIKKKAKE